MAAAMATALVAAAEAVAKVGRELEEAVAEEESLVHREEDLEEEARPVMVAAAAMAAGEAAPAQATVEDLYQVTPCSVGNWHMHIESSCWHSCWSTSHCNAQ